MGHMKAEGIVLRETVYGESDKILTVLAKDIGRITVKARGCRKTGSAISAAAELLMYSELTLSEYRGYLSLKEASVICRFPRIQKDIELLSLASYFCEVCECVCHEGQAENGVLSLLLNSLYALDVLKKPPQLVKTAFEWKISVLCGYEPMADACAVCGRQVPEGPMVNLTDGVVHCASCRSGVSGGISMPLTPAALEVLRYILYGNEKRLFSFRTDEKSLQQLSSAGEAYLMTQLERGFQTLDFYKQLTMDPVPARAEQDDNG